MKTPDLVPNQTTESETLDFKREWGGRAYSIARDLAAFANTYGGHIIIGANENKDNTFKNWTPPNLPKNWEQTLQQANHTYLNPPAIMEFHKCGPQKEQLAIYIHPSPILCAISKPGEIGKLEFPKRRGTHNLNISVQDATMELSSQNRRWWLKLSKAHNNNDKLDLHWKADSAENATIKELTREEVIVSLSKLHIYNFTQEIHHLSIPFEFIQLIWRPKPNSNLRISLKEWFEVEKDNTGFAVMRLFQFNN